MKEADLGIFIDSATRFFDINLGKGEIVVGQPALVSNAQEAPFYEFTGVIDITGDKHGRIFFSAPLALIQRLLENMGETSIDDELIADLVGEIANSIAGTARAHFGSGFNLSTPKIFRDAPVQIDTGKARQAYVVPLKWKDSGSSVAIWFE
jgi:chemotaxis protein CheX